MMNGVDKVFSRTMRDRLFRAVHRPRPPSRREALLAGASSAACLAMLAGSARQALAYENARARRPFRKSRIWADARSLVNRTSFGFTMEMHDEAANRGLEEYLEWQLDHESIDDSDVEARLADFDTLTMSSQEIYDTYQEEQFVPVLQLMRATFLRAVYSKRQLHERMVEFWSDHFSIYILDGLVPFFKTADDRDVIRAHALGTFPDLLNASARSAAMLFYLDNYTNVAGHAQENYARELLELHTLGVDGGYTQQDVEEVARCLTGWTIYDTPDFGEFAFWPPFHDTGAKTVLGVNIPAGGGESDGQTVLDILATHPSTAAFIAHKLCVRFLGYDPPQHIVDSVRDTYLATGGDIKQMLRVILHPDTMMLAMQPKLKRPIHYLASLLRSVQAEIPSNDDVFLAVTQIMGQAPFFWETPNGYPDSLEAWSSSLLPRWQASNWTYDGTLPVTADLEQVLQDVGGFHVPMKVPAMDTILTGEAMTADEVQLVQEFLVGGNANNAEFLAESFGLATSMPSFQWY